MCVFRRSGPTPCPNYPQAIFDPKPIFHDIAPRIGLPDFFPFDRALARANPALIRSLMIDRSNSVKTPHAWNMALPAGVAVSMPRR